MGQTIEIDAVVEVDGVLVVSTDRSLTGQDGETYSPGLSISPDSTFPARLADLLLAADADIDHVYVMSNVISIRRRGGWDPEARAAAEATIASFFRFYPEA